MVRALLSLAVRILIALSTRTFFQPDEYFQALEPAHHLVFGYGHLTWEWRTPRPIRGILYPALNVPIYWALKVLGLDTGSLLILAPRVLHGALATITDVYVCKLAKELLGLRYVSTAHVVSLSSFFHALTLSRSLSNSLETSLSTIAFAYYPWDTPVHKSPAFIRSRTRRALIFAALACSIRSTSVIVWIYLFATLLWRLRSHRRVVSSILLDAFTIGIIVTTTTLLIDTTYYRKPTLTPLNFILTNLSSVSLFYGRNPWHFHLTQSLPVLCTTALPFVLHGIWTTFTKKVTNGGEGLRTMAIGITWTIGVYSIPGHKEWRFIHPILPLLHIFAAKSLFELSNTSDQIPPPDKILQPLSRYLPPIRPVHLYLLLLTLPASAYTILFHNSEPISVMHYLRGLPVDDLRGSIGFLMPCHSTPGHAYLHREELAMDSRRLWALGCEPPLGDENPTTYRDQTDVFYASPKQYLLRYFPRNVDTSFPPSPFPMTIPGMERAETEAWEHEWPRYLVFFGALLEDDGVGGVLEEMGYGEVWKRGGWWSGEGRRKGGVRVWRHHYAPKPSVRPRDT